jgi:pyruvate kinase
VLLAVGEGSSSWDRIEVDYPSLLEDLEAGDRIVLGDGAICLQATERTVDAWRAVVVAGGRAQGRPGVHLPSEKLRSVTPTDDDLELIDRLRPAEVDFLAVSFVRAAADVRRVRDAAGEGPSVMAKIETRTALENLDHIMEAADALMVARGDLGIDCPVEEVPHIQKRIIRSCVAWGMPVVTATQMLESMIHSPLPTRAEASDVANAVFDGTDAVMLSGETAVGHDPALAVQTMARIVERAEAHSDYLQWGGRLGRLQRRGIVAEGLSVAAAVTHAAWQVAVELDADAVLCCTRSGLTARAIARFRPPCAIVGFSPEPDVVRQLNLSWGVTPLPVEWSATTDEIVWLAVERAVQEGVVTHGDTVVVVAGAPHPLPDQPSTISSDVLRVVQVK